MLDAIEKERRFSGTDSVLRGSNESVRRRPRPARIRLIVRQREVVVGLGDIGADLRALRVVSPARGGGRVAQCALVALRGLGRYVDDDASPQIAEPVEPAALRQERGICLSRRCPAVLVTAILHFADDVDVPLCTGPDWYLKALEGMRTSIS